MVNFLPSRVGTWFDNNYLLESKDDPVQRVNAIAQTLAQHFQHLGVHRFGTVRDETDEVLDQLVDEDVVAFYRISSEHISSVLSGVDVAPEVIYNVVAGGGTPMLRVVLEATGTPDPELQQTMSVLVTPRMARFMVRQLTRALARFDEGESS
jgi:hypothetical protein